MKNTTKSTPKLNVGDIFVATGGYDANFAFFYKVVKITEKSARLVPIGSKIVKHGDNCMEHGSVVADETSVPSSTRNAKMCRKNTSSYSGDYVFKVASGGFCEYAYRWDGNPIRTYNYH